MSISTKNGDAGQTDLMYGRRVSKTHWRIEATGCVDELNAALGLSRATCHCPQSAQWIAQIQEQLIVFMGELVCAPEDRERYRADGYSFIESEHTAFLTERVGQLEKGEGLRFRDWARPGAGNDLGAAHLDLARTIGRRAERRVVKLIESGEVANAELVRYLNRLSDLLWLLARLEERPEEELT